MRVCVLRVDSDCISPDVKNSIHVGDRILEINGTPIRNVPVDEVLKNKCMEKHVVYPPDARMCVNKSM